MIRFELQIKKENENMKKENEEIIRKHTSGAHPDDFYMFTELRNNNKFFICLI